MYIAVTGVHVQRNKYTAMQNLLVDRIQFFLHLGKYASRKYFVQRLAYFDLPGSANPISLQQIKQCQTRVCVGNLRRRRSYTNRVQGRLNRNQRLIEVMQVTFPARANRM